MWKPATSHSPRRSAASASKLPLYCTVDASCPRRACRAGAPPRNRGSRASTSAGRGVRERLVERAREFGGEVLELGGEARLRAAARPTAGARPSGVMRVPRPFAFITSGAPKNASHRRQVPCVAVGDVRALGRWRELRGRSSARGSRRAGNRIRVSAPARPRKRQTGRMSMRIIGAIIPRQPPGL